MKFYYKIQIILYSLIVLCFTGVTDGIAQNPSSLPSTLAPDLQNATKSDSKRIERISTYDAARLKTETNAPAVVAEPPLRTSEIDALHKRAKMAIFVVKSHQDPSHKLALNATQFDGACAALARCPQNIDMTVPKQDESNYNTKSSNSFFERGLDKVSSPFAARKSSQETSETQPLQCYITTADWLTNASNIEIIINSKSVKAIPVVRNDKQNVLILKTAPQNGVKGLEIASFDAPQPPVAFALIHPNSIYESFSQQSFVISAPHLYAVTSLTARNGYPLINSRAQIVGLTVSQTVDRTRSNVVHYQLIDRALYPEKYDRTVTEKSEFENY